MKYTKRIAAICMGLVFVISLAGCGKKKVQDAANVVYEFGDDSITYGEYFIYGKTIEEDYQKTYGSGVWNLEMKTDAGTQTVTVTLKTYAKTATDDFTYGEEVTLTYVNGVFQNH